MGGIGIGMTFRQPTPAAGGGETPWYLAGGVNAANCVAAYQAKGAASYAVSKVNLASPGTYDLYVPDGYFAPTWNVNTGWYFTWEPQTFLLTGYTPTSAVRSAIVSFSDALSNQTFRLFGSWWDDAMAVEFSSHPVTDEVFFYNSEYTDCYTLALDVDTNSGIAAISNDAAYWNGIYKGAIPNYPYIGGTIVELAVGGVWDNLADFRYSGTGNIRAIAFYNVALTAEQVAAITTAMQAL